MKTRKINKILIITLIIISFQTPHSYILQYPSSLKPLVPESLFNEKSKDLQYYPGYKPIKHRYQQFYKARFKEIEKQHNINENQSVHSNQTDLERNIGDIDKNGMKNLNFGKNNNNDIERIKKSSNNGTEISYKGKTIVENITNKDGIDFEKLIFSENPIMLKDLTNFEHFSILSSNITMNKPFLKNSSDILKNSMILDADLKIDPNLQIQPKFEKNHKLKNEDESYEKLINETKLNDKNNLSQDSRANFVNLFRRDIDIDKSNSTDNMNISILPENNNEILEKLYNNDNITHFKANKAKKIYESFLKNPNKEVPKRNLNFSKDKNVDNISNEDLNITEINAFNIIKKSTNKLNNNKSNIFGNPAPDPLDIQGILNMSNITSLNLTKKLFSLGREYGNYSNLQTPIFQEIQGIDEKIEKQTIWSNIGTLLTFNEIKEKLNEFHDYYQTYVKSFSSEIQSNHELKNVVIFSIGIFGLLLIIVCRNCFLDSLNSKMTEILYRSQKDEKLKDKVLLKGRKILKNNNTHHIIERKSHDSDSSNTSDENFQTFSKVLKELSLPEEKDKIQEPIIPSDSLKFGSIFNKDILMKATLNKSGFQHPCLMNAEDHEESINIDIETFIRELDEENEKDLKENEKVSDIKILDYKEKEIIEVLNLGDSEVEKKARRLSFLVNMHIAEETLITKCLKQPPCVKEHQNNSLI